MLHCLHRTVQVSMIFSPKLESICYDILHKIKWIWLQKKDPPWSKDWIIKWFRSVIPAVWKVWFSPQLFDRVHILVGKVQHQGTYILLRFVFGGSVHSTRCLLVFFRDYIFMLNLENFIQLVSRDQSKTITTPTTILLLKCDLAKHFWTKHHFDHITLLSFHPWFFLTKNVQPQS